MEQQLNPAPQLKIINDPPLFSGATKDLDGFLTRIELAIEANPRRFPDDRRKVMFVISYFTGRALNWASCLRRNNNEVLRNYENFINELRRNFGDPDVDAAVANGKLNNIRQFKYGHVMEYITAFQKISQYSNFNESAKIFMYIKGLHPKMRERLALVNPNPNNLEQLFRESVNIESLTKRNDIQEYYLTHQDRRNYNQDDPMDVDLYRIKKGQKVTRYFPSHNKNYIENKSNIEERRKKRLCFKCGEAGHMQFNCPNRIKPKNFKMINKVPNEDPSSSATSISTSSSVRRIKKVEKYDNIYKVLDIVENENINFKGKTNILDFYIKTNESDEVKAKVLIDSGSDINCIHPEFARVNNIKLMNIDNSFKVAGLGYGLSTVKKITEKCILRFKNHYEIIQLHSLRIPDVDIILGLPWIEKHCPINYHDSKKISFSSGYCARHCNVGKRNRKNKNKKKLNKISSKGKEPYEELSLTKEKINPKRKYSFESDSDMNSDEEITIRSRRTRIKTCSENEELNGLKNFCIINYDSDVNDSFMFDNDDEIYEFSDSNNINLDELNKICKIDVLCKNVTKNCNHNDNLNKDESKKYISKKCSVKNLCCICNCLKISNF